jgi:hypothetical protein
LAEVGRPRKQGLFEGILMLYRCVHQCTANSKSIKANCGQASDRSAAKAAQRIVQLRDSYANVGSTTYLTLAEIRQLMDLTQESVAAAQAIKQPSVQRIEKRGNVEVMTLARHVRALGGRLEMSVVFDDMEARLELSALDDRRD